jgi:hypothetical protein
MSETVTAAPEGASEQQDAPVSASVETPAAPAEPQTIRDTALAAYEAIEKREREEGKERGPDGRYASSQPNDAEPEAAAQPERLAPPEGFSDKAQVDWNRLPRSVQEGILSRVTAAPPAPPPDPFVETARSLRGAFEQHGLIPERALPDIVNAWQQLVANPQAVLPELAKRFGVEWGGPPQQAQPNEAQNVWVDPEIQRLRTEIAELKQFQQERISREQAAQAAEVQRVYQSTRAELDAFAKDKPDFEAVRQDMAALIQSGAAKDLQDAYEKAVWANPQTRAARLEAERKAEEAKRQAEAEKARRAAAINVRSDSRVNPAPAATMRETMERAAERLYSA